jgi:hypothetical protein
MNAKQQVLSDQLWSVVKPRCGTADAIEEMNAKMLAFHSALHSTRKSDPRLVHYAKAVMERDISAAELFRSIISSNY